MTRLFLIAVAGAALATTGCSVPGASQAVPPSSSQPAVVLSPAGQVFALKTGYQAPLVLAVAYNKRPPCGAGAPILCRDAAIVSQMRKANDAALATLDAAESIARTPGVTMSAVTLSIAAAENSVKAFEAIVSIYAK